MSKTEPQGLKMLPRPIKTAPRDRRILLYFPNEDVWISGAWDSWDDDGPNGRIVLSGWVTDGDLIIEDGPRHTPKLWLPFPCLAPVGPESSREKALELERDRYRAALEAIVSNTPFRGLRSHPNIAKEALATPKEKP